MLVLPHTARTHARTRLALLLQLHWRAKQLRRGRARRVHSAARAALARLPPPCDAPAPRGAHAWERDADGAVRTMRDVLRTRHGVDGALVDALAAARREVPGAPWMVEMLCPDEVLRAVAVRKPRTVDELVRVPGFPEWHVHELAEHLLACMARQGA